MGRGTDARKKEAVGGVCDVSVGTCGYHGRSDQSRNGEGSHRSCHSLLSRRCAALIILPPQVHGFMTSVRFFLLVTSILLPFVLVGCDSGGATGSAGGDTAIFNANSPIPPTVEYEFEYDQNDRVDGSDFVEVTSNSTDDLEDVLDDNGGFRRSSIVSARVDSVKFSQVSPKNNEPSAPKFVFDNLRRASVFLGTDANGAQIAEGEFDPNSDAEEVSLSRITTDVTQTIKNGSTKAFLRLEVSDISRKDIVDVKVFYRIKVEGV